MQQKRRYITKRDFDVDLSACVIGSKQANVLGTWMTKGLMYGSRRWPSRSQAAGHIIFYYDKKSGRSRGLQPTRQNEEEPRHPTYQI